MAQMSTIISGAVSLGVLAGVVSGIFYLVLTGIRWAGRVRAALKEEEERKNATRCVSCGRTFSASATSPIVCTICGKCACFDLPCSRPAPIGWNCVICHIKRNLDSSSGSSWTDVKSDEEKQASGSDVDGETIKVREFIEKLVEKIVGGSLDGVTVGKLSNHHSYAQLFTQYHEQLCQALARLGFALQLSLSSQNVITEEAPSTAHTSLIQLIEKLIKDAAKLPDLTERGQKIQKSKIASTIGDKSYEDILSTAILNKVIQNYQNKNYYKNDSCDDSDWSDISRQDPVMKIEEHIEEITTAYGSSSDELEEEIINEPIVQNRRVPFPEYGVDIVEQDVDSNNSDAESCATDVHSNQSTWEENWLFQRKKLKIGKNSHHPVPVPMLVPNPSQEYRALIGGIDADDISDLSECSDSVLEEAMSEATTEDPNKVLEIIDALNRESDDSEDESNKFESKLNEELPSSDSQISKDSLEIESPVSPTPSLGQQDRDVPVDYEVIVQIDCPPIPKPRTLDRTVEEKIKEEDEEEEEEEEKVIVCPIAEREKAKWKNAIEMKDNPYTPENIAKRIKSREFLYMNGKSSTDSIDFPGELSEMEETPRISSRAYSRDYYVRASKSPTGQISTRSSVSPVSMRSDTSFEYFATPYRLEFTHWKYWTAELLEPKEEGDESLIMIHHERIVDQRSISELPKVSELRKNFLTAKPPISPRKQHSNKEPEIDYSLTPVSEIISKFKNLSTSSESIEPTDKQQQVFNEVAQIRREKFAKFTNFDKISTSSQDEISDCENQFLPVAKKPLKAVHSLTARSIPKDFREGLKKNSHSRNIPKTDRVCEIYSATDNSTLPLLNVDVKNTKKFFENFAKEK